MQARTILLQTGLAQQTLAAVWNISDIDKVRILTDVSRNFHFSFFILNHGHYMNGMKPLCL